MKCSYVSHQFCRFTLFTLFHWLSQPKFQIFAFLSGFYIWWNYEKSLWIYFCCVDCNVHMILSVGMIWHQCWHYDWWAADTLLIFQHTFIFLLVNNNHHPHFRIMAIKKIFLVVNISTWPRNVKKLNELKICFQF